MPYDGADVEDPLELAAVTVPADAGSELEMAYVFAEEFARLGYGARRILGLFRTPFYAGAHRAWCALGETEMAAIVDQCVGVWGPHASAEE